MRSCPGSAAVAALAAVCLSAGAARGDSPASECRAGPAGDPFPTCFDPGLRLVAGHERRNESRLRLERTVQPLRTARNMTFIVSGALIFYGLALATMLLLSSVVEF